MVEDGVEVADNGGDIAASVEGELGFLFLIASACLLGGPLLLLGRSYVQGISRTAQA